MCVCVRACVCVCVCVCVCRMFRIIDDDGNRSLSLPEFKKGCRDYGLDLEGDAVQNMFRSFDRDGSGSIDFDEFLRALRVSMPELCCIYSAEKMKVALLLAVPTVIEINHFIEKNCTGCN